MSRSVTHHGAIFGGYEDIPHSHITYDDMSVCKNAITHTHTHTHTHYLLRACLHVITGRHVFGPFFT